jgi:xanthine/CO dehydrogenase XdhC/CoxF family maturation factor
LTDLGNPESLGEAIAKLAGDRAALATLIDRAASDGRRFTSKAVFAERSELIKSHLR